MKRAVIGILAHVDAGKTTLSERILYLTGRIRKMGRVDTRDTHLDTYELERSRGITIFSKQAVFPLGDWSVTLLDTPGHVDFSAEMERTLQVLDYAILLISGADGIQGHTETLWRLLKRYEIPCFLFINKMDQEGTDAQALIKEIQKRLDENCVDFGQKKEELWESLATCEEKLLEEYLDECQEELRLEQEAQGLYLRPRFSPGYGDFSVLHQGEILRMLDAPKRIGLSVTDGNMLTPTKSVTAVIGVGRTQLSCHVKGCENCGKSDCAYRRDKGVGE